MPARARATCSPHMMSASAKLDAPLWEPQTRMPYALSSCSRSPFVPWIDMTWSRNAHQGDSRTPVVAGHWLFGTDSRPDRTDRHAPRQALLLWWEGLAATRMQ